jgi:hypothetical protein
LIWKQHRTTKPLEVTSEFSNILFILQLEEELYKVYFVQFKVQTVHGTKSDDIGIEGGEAYFFFEWFKLLLWDKTCKNWHVLFGHFPAGKVCSDDLWGSRREHGVAQ